MKYMSFNLINRIGGLQFDLEAPANTWYLYESILLVSAFLPSYSCH